MWKRGGRGEEELSSVKNQARNCDPMAMRIRIANAVANGPCEVQPDVQRVTWARCVKFVASMKGFETRSRAILLRRARQWRATCKTRRRCGCVYPAAGAAVGDWCARRAAAASLRRSNAAKIRCNVALAALDGVFEGSPSAAALQGVGEGAAGKGMRRTGITCFWPSCQPCVPPAAAPPQHDHCMRPR